jgi:hypothetical protein
MKQIWKCDFCSEINADKSVIEIHEKQCGYNPKNRKCFSCPHLKELTSGWGGATDSWCRPKGFNCYRVMNGEEICKNWGYPRKEKLKRILNL